MPKFRKLPVVVEAEQLTWENWDNICLFVPDPWFLTGCYINKDGTTSNFPHTYPQEGSILGLKIKTLESNSFTAKETDWIIKGVKGEFYACDNEIFMKTYEEVKD